MTQVDSVQAEPTASVEAAPVETPGPGTLLRRARESRGMTLDEVGASLKMSSRQVEAVEKEDYSRLSGATFIRGFIRNYAKLLKIDPAEPLAALEARTALPVAVLSMPSGSGIRMPSVYDRDGKGSRLALVSVVVLLVIALVLYFDVVDVDRLLGHGAATSSVSKGGEALLAIQPEIVQPGVDASTVSPTQTPNQAQTQAQTLAQTLAPVEGAVGSEPAVLKPGEHTLAFSFDGDSWVEVKDATGRTLISQLNPKGSTQTLIGRSPFQLAVGNAANVRLQYDELAVDLRPHTRVEVARLTLD